jgi:hypothetical protein
MCIGAMSGIAAGLTAAFAAHADTTTINPAKDATLIEAWEDISETGELANGSGVKFFAGRTLKTFDRRAVMEFDIAGAVPAGATIDSVALRLNMDRAREAAFEFNDLHVLTTEWTEGPSDAPGQEGAGAPSEAGDVTWLHTTYPAVFWTNPGGDFSAVVSASTLVGDNGTYTWSTIQMAADVQAWLDDPSSNHGWILIGNEDSTDATAYRFGSREGSNPPTLEINYTLECAPDFDGNNVVDGSDLAELLAFWGSSDPEKDLTGDGVVDGADLANLLAFWGPCFP